MCPKSPCPQARCPEDKGKYYESIYKRRALKASCFICNQI